MSVEVELVECSNVHGDIFHCGDRVHFRAEWVEPYTAAPFEVIVSELAAKSCIRANYHLCETWSSEEEPAVFLTDAEEEEGFEPIVIHRNGTAELKADFTHDQLAASAAACKEIEENVYEK